MKGGGGSSGAVELVVNVIITKHQSVDSSATVECSQLKTKRNHAKRQHAQESAYS